MRKLTKKEKTFIQYGFLIFLIGLTTYLVSTTLDIKLIPRIVKLVNKKYILSGIFLMLVYMFLEVIIIKIIIDSIQRTKSKFISFKMATMGFYYNLVTPFASGSQPMQIYTLKKNNISFSKAVAIVTNKTVVFQAVVTLFCGILIPSSMGLLKSEVHSVIILVAVGMSMNTFMLIFGLLIVFNPKKIKNTVHFTISTLVKFRIFKFLESKLEKIDHYIDEYNKSIKMFIRNKTALALSLGLTLIQLIVFFSVVYFIYKSFNLMGTSYFSLLRLQVFLYMAISPIPTPGNVGANEIVFLKIFSGVFPKEYIGYMVFLYSGYVYYFVLIVSGLFTIGTHYNLSKGKEKQLKSIAEKI